MIELMRSELSTQLLNSKTDSIHAGLLLQRTLKGWETDEEKKQLRRKKERSEQLTEKEKQINLIVAVSAPPIYQLAFDRWLMLTGAAETFSWLAATVDGRLFTGLNTGGSIETGVITHHTYGMPMIAGSSVKGAVRQYAEAVKLDPKYLAILFGHGEDDPSHDADGNLLNDDAGYLIWHDAWWIPKTSVQKPFVQEIVTVHHQEYYAGTQIEATDFDSPVPNQQLAVQGSFYFAIEGDARWLEVAKQLLENTLLQNGLGAKAASGYGYFKIDEQLSETLKEKYKTLVENQCKEQERKKILAEKQRKEEELKKILAEKQRKEEELKKILLSLSEKQQIIKKFELNLPDQKLWKDKPQHDVIVEVDGQKYQFLDIFELIKSWEDIEDLKYAVDIFEKNIKIWLGKSLGKNQKWKERINLLKKRAGLI